jgi:hypothetical protein
MSSWSEPEWKLPRKGDVVKGVEGIDGVIGRVVRSAGTMTDRNIWIEDVNGIEIFSDEPGEQFARVDKETTIKFQLERLRLKGFYVGALCSYKGNLEIPLEIVQMDWNFIRNKMEFCLKDLRKFELDPLKTDDEELLEIFDQYYPSIDNIYADKDNGLKYRLIVSLSEKDEIGWTTTGSPWEFMNKEDALLEVERWKSRLKVRRVASVLASDWKVEFPCWTIESTIKDNDFLLRVKKIESSTGAPGYFKTALHAAHALKIIDVNDWKNVFDFSQDFIII